MQFLEGFLSGLPCDWLNNATRCRKGNVEELRAISGGLAERYSLYERVIFNYRIDLEPTIFNDSKTLLLDYYEHAPASLNRELQIRRNQHGLYLCPFCGNPIKPDTLDHFIPKDLWPEYSIFPNNLVPQCRKCAPIKGSNYFCVEGGAAKFIHPIYSDLLQRFRFKITVNFDTATNEPSFLVVLIKIQETDDGEDQRVIFHLRNLNIKIRIVDFCQDYYRRWHRKLSRMRFDLRVALRIRLEEIHQVDRGRDWKSAFIEGLLNNDDAINYLHSLCPSVISEPEPNISEELDID